MGNRVVAMACAFFKTHPAITSIEDFRSKFADLPRTLPAQCVIDEIENIARREFGRRIDAAKKPEYIDGPDGEKIEVRRKRADSKHTPLTSFLVPAVDANGRAVFRYYHLRPTKGWVSELVDAGEASLYQKQGVPNLVRFDGPNRAVVRRVA